MGLDDRKRMEDNLLYFANFAQLVAVKDDLTFFFLGRDDGFVVAVLLQLFFILLLELKHLLDPRIIIDRQFPSHSSLLQVVYSADVTNPRKVQSIDFFLLAFDHLP